MSDDKKSQRPQKADFSIDDFITEIEKAEEIEASKPLPQHRLRNKRALDRADADAAKRKTTKTSNPDTKTGMSKRSPKSKANAVERPTNLDGFSESPQAGFNHIPEAKAKSKANAESLTGSSGGVTATVQALQDLIEHGRKEVEGTDAWQPHRPTRPPKLEGGQRFELATDFTPQATSPPRLPNWAKASRTAKPIKCCLGSQVQAKPLPSLH